jgi:hypothetical protein
MARPLHKLHADAELDPCRRTITGPPISSLFPPFCECNSTCGGGMPVGRVYCNGDHGKYARWAGRTSEDMLSLDLSTDLPEALPFTRTSNRAGQILGVLEDTVRHSVGLLRFLSFASRRSYLILSYQSAQETWRFEDAPLTQCGNRSAQLASRRPRDESKGGPQPSTNLRQQGEPDPLSRLSHRPSQDLIPSLVTSPGSQSCLDRRRQEALVL